MCHYPLFRSQKKKEGKKRSTINPQVPRCSIVTQTIGGCAAQAVHVLLIACDLITWAECQGPGFFFVSLLEGTRRREGREPCSSELCLAKECSGFLAGQNCSKCKTIARNTYPLPTGKTESGEEARLPQCLRWESLCKKAPGTL